MYYHILLAGVHFADRHRGILQLKRVSVEAGTSNKRMHEFEHSPKLNFAGVIVGHGSGCML